MKILMAADCYPDVINGVATSVMALKKALEARGNEVKLLTLNPSVHSKKIGEDIYAIGSVSAGDIYPDARFTFNFSSHLIEELIKWKPDVIHTNTEFTTFMMAVRISRECHAPMVHTYHTVYEDYTHYFSPSKTVGKKMVKEFSNMVSQCVDTMIVPTPKISEMLLNYGIKKVIYVVPTGIDLSKFQNPPSAEWIREKKEQYGLTGRKTTVFVGRVAKEKNVEEVIHAFRSLPDDYALLIVGDGPDRERMQRESADMKNVIFTGMVDRAEVQNYYYLGDMFCSASTSETQGLTYYEAMSCGLPLVCRKDECLESILFNDVNGYQYSEPEELPELIRKVLSDPAVTKKMSEESVRIVDAFSLPNFGKSVETIYKKTIENHVDHEDLLKFAVEAKEEVSSIYYKMKSLTAVQNLMEITRDKTVNLAEADLYDAAAVCTAVNGYDDDMKQILEKLYTEGKLVFQLDRLGSLIRPSIQNSDRCRAAAVKLEEINRQKIDLSDVLIVVKHEEETNEEVEGYIRYAQETGKKVLYRN